MRPAEISQEQIIEAGKALQAEGRNITGFALRQRVGAGNPARMRQVWDEYVQTQAGAVAAPEVELPAEVAEGLASASQALVDRLSALVASLNEQAVRAADRRVTEAVRSAGEQREQAERELADAAQAVEELEARLRQAQEQGEALRQQLEALQAAHQAQAVELGQAQARAQTLQESQAALMAALARGELDQQQPRRKGGKGAGDQG